MNICIAGWYFEPALMPILEAVHPKYPVTVLTSINRALECKEQIAALKVPHWELPLAGLEFAKYDHFLKNIWSGGSVLFMHDDILVDKPEAFDKIAALKHDQVFIFNNEEEGRCNQHFHGRMIYCSEAWLRVAADYVCDCAQTTTYADHHHNMFCSMDCYTRYAKTAEIVCEASPIDVSRKTVNCFCSMCRTPLPEKYVGVLLRGIGPHKGFWFDPFNDGRHARGRVPMGLRHYNDGIYHFAMFAKRLRSGLRWKGQTIKMDSDVKICNTDFIHGKRGVYGRNK